MTQLQQNAVAVFASVKEHDAQTLRLLANGLGLAPQPLTLFGQAFDYWADAIENPAAINGRLATLAMRHAIRSAGHDQDATHLADRLEGLGEAPWTVIAKAIRDQARTLEVTP